MEWNTIGEIFDALKGAVREKGNSVEILDEKKLRGEPIDSLIYNAVFSSSKEVVSESRRLIKAIAGAFGTTSASIHNLYEAMGRGEAGGFTVPAVNIRGLTFDTARAFFRSALRNKSGAFIFEIAKSEIGYTGQRPAEYTACCLAAAIKEGYRGPVFIQGDHFQINAKKFVEDRDRETADLKKLIKEALEAEFYNIDIDSSTVVDLTKPSVIEQQRPNFETTALLTEYIRQNEPSGVTVSVGGEIGEVGGKNSTEEELRAFMEGFASALPSGRKGISKISIQTGTSHGGVVLPDGTIAKVKVDFDTIERLSKVAREYGMAGVVQHGASTLPDDAFHMFVARGAAEVHLATGFQNMVYDSPAFPADLKADINRHLIEKHSDERKPADTEEQFLYKTRKKGFGPFKERIWTLDADRRAKIGSELEARFDLYFEQLNAKDTMKHVKKFVG
ncbi:MAG: aldolase [Deltaproteobacteria bacterium GWB2_55_19]|nr:MAG: aldolase [Deltaproteobacteria bacterium GWB2_55_19]HAO92563.1 aldolase [Deltaproteobacteria bacterium]